MPRNDIENDFENGQEKRGGGLLGLLIALVIILVWIIIFALLIKMDVGGFGSNIMRPLIKDIPGINMILPSASSGFDNTDGYSYKTLYDAIERIRELEENNAIMQDQLLVDKEAITDLQNEVLRLRVFEQNQLAFDALKKKFDEEVVFTDKAPDINEYKSWYEQIEPENAALLYEKVIERLAYSEKVKEWAKTYSKMDADAAAAILSEMTGDLDLVTQILLNLNAQQRAEILANMDPVYAAKLTHVMYPE